MIILSITVVIFVCYNCRHEKNTFGYNFHPLSCVLEATWGVKWQFSVLPPKMFQFWLFLLMSKIHPAMSLIIITHEKKWIQWAKILNFENSYFSCSGPNYGNFISSKSMYFDLWVKFSIIIERPTYHYDTTTLTQWKKYFFKNTEIILLFL